MIRRVIKPAASLLMLVFVLLPSLASPSPAARVLSLDLCTDWMLVVMRPEGRFPQNLGMRRALGKHNAGKGQRRAEIEGQSAHCIVAVAAQRGLQERDVEDEIAQF